MPAVKRGHFQAWERIAIGAIVAALVLAFGIHEKGGASLPWWVGFALVVFFLIVGCWSYIGVCLWLSGERTEERRLYQQLELQLRRRVVPLWARRVAGAILVLILASALVSLLFSEVFFGFMASCMAVFGVGVAIDRW
ncbi:MAG TPA: hypothetical protein VOA87_17605 [Thermoanaerobaculia bacterium]|nr:hypothetical protein [Thermoanaerobaculia bacterium]